MDRSELLALAAKIAEQQESLCDLDYRLCLELGHLEDAVRFASEAIVSDELDRLGYTGIYE